MKYPFILFFRYDKYNYIDTFFKDNSHLIECSLNIIKWRRKISRTSTTHPSLMGRKRKRFSP